MPLSREPMRKVDFSDKRVKDFVKGGAPVLEDVREEERRIEQDRIKEELKRHLEEETKKIAEEEAKRIIEEARIKVEEDKKFKENEEYGLQMISMRIPLKLLREIDESAKNNYTNRTAWMIETIQKRLKREKQGVSE